MTQKNSSQSGTANPSSSPSQKQEASDTTASISPSSAQHGNALTEGGESASAQTLTTSDGPSHSLPDSPTKSTDPQAVSGSKSQEASVLSECQKPNSDNSTMPHSTCCANSSCPKQTEDAKHSSTNSPTSEFANLTKSDRKELARLYAAALFYKLEDDGIKQDELSDMVKLIETTLSAHRTESTQTDNQLRLTGLLHKRILERNNNKTNHANAKDSH